MDPAQALRGQLASANIAVNGRAGAPASAPASGSGSPVGEAAFVSQSARQPLRILSVSPPDTHRRFIFNLRCVSGGDTEG